MAEARDAPQESNDQLLVVWADFVDCIEKENRSIVFEKLTEKLKLEWFESEKLFAKKVGS